MLKVGVPGFTQVPQLLVYNRIIYAATQARPVSAAPAFTGKAHTAQKGSPCFSRGAGAPAPEGIKCCVLANRRYKFIKSSLIGACHMKCGVIYYRFVKKVWKEE